MPRFYLKLVDGAHDLEHETAAQIAAIELARSIRQGRLELVGQIAFYCGTRAAHHN
jgi:hypothetical protein